MTLDEYNRLSEAEQEAYRRGVADRPGPDEEPGADRYRFNPYDGDAEPLLYDAWEEGFESDDCLVFVHHPYKPEAS